MLPLLLPLTVPVVLLKMCKTLVLLKSPRFFSLGREIILERALKRLEWDRHKEAEAQVIPQSLTLPVHYSAPMLHTIVQDAAAFYLALLHHCL